MAMNDSAVCYLSFQRLYPSGILTLKKGGFFLRAVFFTFLFVRHRALFQNREWLYVGPDIFYYSCTWYVYLYVYRVLLPLLLLLMLCVLLCCWCCCSSSAAASCCCSSTCAGWQNLLLVFFLFVQAQCMFNVPLSSTAAFTTEVCLHPR